MTFITHDQAMRALARRDVLRAVVDTNVPVFDEYMTEIETAVVALLERDQAHYTRLAHDYVACWNRLEMKERAS